MERILFTDESSFDVNVRLTKQKDRVWSSLQKEPEPSTIIYYKQFPKNVMVWAGFSLNFKIAPFFFNENFTAESYQNMLESHEIPALK